MQAKGSCKEIFMTSSELLDRLARAKCLQQEHHLSTAEALAAVWGIAKAPQRHAVSSIQDKPSLEALEPLLDRLVAQYSAHM
jgi:hypothetical protein